MWKQGQYADGAIKVTFLKAERDAECNNPLTPNAISNKDKATNHNNSHHHHQSNHRRLQKS
jgi:hypothetical protein